MRKRRYRIYRSPNGETVRVKLGFSWRAFFLGSLSAMVRRLWLVGAVGLIAFAAEVYLQGAPAPTSRLAGLALALLAFYAAYMLFCGVNGNRWLSESLRRRGFTLVDEDGR